MDLIATVTASSVTAEEFARGHRAMGEAFRNYRPTPARHRALQDEVIRATNHKSSASASE